MPPLKKAQDQQRHPSQTMSPQGEVNRAPASKSGPRPLRTAIRQAGFVNDHCLTHFGSNPDRGFDSDWLGLAQIGAK